MVDCTAAAQIARMHGGDAVGYNVSYSILFIPYQPFSARSVIKYVRKILGI